MALILLTMQMQEDTIDLMQPQFSKYDYCISPVFLDYSKYVTYNNITDMEALFYLDLNVKFTDCLEEPMIKLFNNITITETIVENKTDMDFNYTLLWSNITSYTEPPYEPTLNMSNLRYNGKEVDWVYQIEKPVGDWSIKIIPCIILKNGTRYCEE